MQVGIGGVPAFLLQIGPTLNSDIDVEDAVFDLTRDRHGSVLEAFRHGDCDTRRAIGQLDLGCPRASRVGHDEHLPLGGVHGNEPQRVLLTSSGSNAMPLTRRLNRAGTSLPVSGVGDAQPKRRRTTLGGTSETGVPTPNDRQYRDADGRRTLDHRSAGEGTVFEKCSSFPSSSAIDRGKVNSQVARIHPVIQRVR